MGIRNVINKLQISSWTKLKLKGYIFSSAGNSTKFEITDAKLNVPMVTLSTKDSVNLSKQLCEGFKRSVYWNSYQTKPANVIEKGKNAIRIT